MIVSCITNIDMTLLFPEHTNN